MFNDYKRRKQELELKSQLTLKKRNSISSVGGASSIDPDSPIKFQGVPSKDYFNKTLEHFGES